ncbi:kinase [Marinobacter salicampi]|uniref:kinase n=1 Tax=Marinobacter salicampi TaxID=435907 RepID=UPI00140A60A1|nr:kinase [Marinobacter salicampi]
MSQPEARYSIRSLLAAVLITIIITVITLEMSGRIDHSDDKTNAPVGEFTAIHVKPGEDFRMSSKASELHAVCQNGYLGVAPDVDPTFVGILVDYKNRGVRCGRPDRNRPETAEPEPAPAPEAGEAQDSQ